MIRVRKIKYSRKQAKEQGRSFYYEVTNNGVVKASAQTKEIAERIARKLSYIHIPYINGQ